MSVSASSLITRCPTVLTTASYLAPKLLDGPVVGAVVPVGTRSLLLVPLPDLHLQVGVGILQGTHLVQVGGQAVVEVLHRLLLSGWEDAIASSKATSETASEAGPEAASEAGPVATPEGSTQAPSDAAAVAAPIAAAQPRDDARGDGVAAGASVDAGGSVASSAHAGKPAGASPQPPEGGGGGVLPDSGGAHGEGQWSCGAGEGHPARQRRQRE